ncbi:serine hydrolase [Aquimarina sp. RZ0]|uniref:serine hydrolase domain-containing protein n=1 Tax=Aquimarina sp. RZ0 TaxID=2607730 RepID=UPI0011F0EB94|nr:serine hydrolase domain-containing protein [Aquimarina sp. RZ0]KAA1247491.1 beta-lactamase family protein [Aquimarina sp. RZ0]
MKYLFRIYISCLLVGCTTSKTPEKKAVVLSKKPVEEAIDSLSFFLEHYDKFFRTNFQISECPGAAIVIVKDSTVIYKKGFGVKKIHTQDSVDTNTVFRIASLSKGVTAVLAGNLVDHKELNWDQQIKESVYNFDLRDKAQADRLTVNHLLSHTSGLYKYTNSRLIHKGLPLTTIIAGFKKSGVVAKEGTDYEYQNAAFSVIEKIMENQTETSFETLLSERLFIPANMKNASSSYHNIKNNTNVALPHKWNHYSKKYSLTRLHKNYYNVAAAGGINASISDMAEYLKVLLGNRPDIISDSSLKDIFNPVICTSNKATYVNLWDGVTDSYYAKGWRVLDYRRRTIIYHGGNVNQYKTQLMIDPKNKIGICVLFNGPNPFNGPVIPTFLSYYDFFVDATKN